MVEDTAQGMLAAVHGMVVGTLVVDIHTVVGKGCIHKAVVYIDYNLAAVQQLWMVLSLLLLLFQLLLLLLLLEVVVLLL